MQMKKGKILWADDEIELLRPHILFLEEKGYEVVQVTNADDAISLIRREPFDLLLLDEMMAGKDGLTALAEVKEIRPSLPVVMITKNEEESLMEEAIGGKIDDYLTKPVNPSQILSTCKKFVESREIEGARLARDYPAQFNQMALAIMNARTWQEWIDIYTKIVDWELDLERYPDLGLRHILDDQKKSANLEFGRFVEKNYLDWIHESPDSPTLSVDVVAEHVAPLLTGKKKVAFVIIDNMRLDQWLSIEPFLFPYFNVTRHFYYSILPTATPFSRNGIFSGLYPLEIEQKYPDLWNNGTDDDFSRNRYERQLLDFQLQEMGLKIKPEPKYIKILDVSEGRSLERNIKSYMQTRLLSIVVNFVDIFSHNRSTSEILKEIVPDEAAFRSLTKSWFEHSYLYRVLRILSEEGFTVVMTSDHGSVRAMRGAKVIGDRETSTNLRYKFGRNLKCDSKFAFFIKDPREYKLPTRGISINYIIAKEDYYFVYPTNFHKYLNYYKDSFQHGGISMEEMILPVLRLDPK